jgi:Na+/phosphate symporter
VAPWLLPLLIAASVIIGMFVPRRWGWFTRAAVGVGLIVLSIELSLLLPETLDIDRWIK